jgi:uncharacterized protein HemY
LGRALIQEQKYGEARASLERAVELKPDLTEAYYRLGTVYGRLGEKEKAKQALAAFQRHRSGEMTERQEMLKAMSDVLQSGSTPAARRD